MLRFTLRSLLTLALLVGSGAMLWMEWEPWYLHAELEGCPTGGYDGVYISPSGWHVVTWMANDIISVWDTRSGEPV